jgi:Arylsulfotransferase (ASST)
MKTSDMRNYVWERGRRGGLLLRRFASWVFLSVLAARFAAIGVPQEAHAVGGVAAVTVRVTGGPLGNVTSSPLAISPVFAGTTTDYVLRCQAGINTIQLTLDSLSGGVITIGGRSGSSIVVQESLIENQALIITAPNPNGGTPIQFWIRCLPHDFPQLAVTKARPTPAGWYLTGNILSSGGGAYAMVLDSNGTPVWYQNVSGSFVFNTTPLADGTIAWISSGDPGFEDYNLKTQTARWLTGPLGTDVHELEEMSNGDLMMLSYVPKPNVDLTSLGLGSSVSILDCVVQEVGSDGQLVWEWRASDHIAVNESTHSPAVQWGDQTVYDLFHCNSIDTNLERSLVLLSARHADAVYLIDRSTGRTIWKMGGTPSNSDGAEIIAITGDPQGAFHAQHDARFEPNGDVSLYDNQSWDSTLAARGVEYHIDPNAATANLVWSYPSPDGQNSLATGSFRRLGGGADNIIGWGLKIGTLFSEVDAAGNLLLNVALPAGQFAYRVQKVGLAALDHDLLRASAGLPPFSSTPDNDSQIATSGATLAATEATGLTGTVATFSDPDATATASEYLATIAWSDGSSSPGTIMGPDGGPFTVSGTHTYAEEGANVVTVYITDASDPSNTAAVSSTVNVHDAALSASCATPANSLTTFNGAAATIADGDPSATASDYAATISWGDGSSTQGAVSGPDGSPFTISGAHTYATTGKFNITTSANDSGGATSSTSCPALIYAFPSGTGAFAIGDKSSAKDADVTFWGGKWSKLNSLTGGLAPDSFNGFGQTLTLPNCGVAWDATTGNGNAPAANALPTYMGVIVTSSVTQSGSTDSGNAIHIAIVRTKPGYQPDSGHPGTGTVVAQVC